jgi:hypothetical protein
MKALAPLAVALIAAAAPPRSYPVHGDTGRACNAAKAKALIGRRRGAAVEREVSRLGGGSVRWIPVGTMVTMDYRPERLNLRLDRRGRIVSVNCG